MKTKLTILFLVVFTFVRAQDRFDILDEKLNQLSKSYAGINEKVELSVNAVSIQEFVRAIGNNNNLNVNVDPLLDIKITNNFKDVSAKDIFVFLCKKYDLDISLIGPIISFTKYIAPSTPIKVASKKALDINYQPTVDLLSYDLNADTIGNVTREITKQSGKNIIFSPDLAGKTISGFMQNATFNNALEKLAFGNDMKVTLTADGFYVFEKNQVAKEGDKPKTGNLGSLGTKTNNEKKSDAITIKDGLIYADAQNIPIAELVNAVSSDLNKNYFLFSELKGSATVKINDVTYDDFLKLLFNGTEFTFKKEGDVYLVGDRNLEGLRQSKLIQLKNRTIDKILEFVPAELKKGVDLKVFVDLNGIIASGSQPRINELESFLRQLDLVVPMVHIEVIIADVRKSNTLSAGLSAVLGSKPATTSGTLLPSANLILNSTSINNLISGINGLGIINLGNVTANFYATLTALEQQGILKLRSTPQIATLNGHEAKLSIGNTEYYLEVQNQLVNTSNTQQNLLQSQNYKPVNADLSLTIDPQVSGDEQITMKINVKQSSFTARISNTAPPGSINRDFQSLVRVKNGEMVMLGGLEENSVDHSGSGLPGVSKIPFLRWLFGNRTKKKTENKLTIFIKPTIIYS